MNPQLQVIKHSWEDYLSQMLYETKRNKEYKYNQSEFCLLIGSTYRM